MSALNEPGFTAWQTVPHRQLYEQVNTGPGREASRLSEELWTQVQGIVDEGHAGLRRELGQAAQEWIGHASSAMQAAVQPFVSWCGATVDDAGSVAACLAAQGEHATRLRRLMPGPNGFTNALIDIGETATTVANPALIALPDEVNPVHQAADGLRESTAEAEDARRLMGSYADDSAQRAGGLTFWTTPPTMVVAPATLDAAPGGPAGGGSGGGASSPAPGAGPTAPSGNTPARGQPPHHDRTVAPGLSSGSLSSGSLSAGGSSTAVPGPSPAPPRTGQRSAGAPGLVPAPMPSGTGARQAPRARAPLAPQVQQRGNGIGLSDGQGGRGLKAAPFTAHPSRTGGPHPGAPRNWRELVAGQPQPARPPVVAEPVVRAAPAGEPTPGAPGRAGTEGRGSHLYPPMAGAGAGGTGERTKSRPAYLQDDSGYFSDDRWVSEAVIGPDDVLPGDDRR
ncbi:MAG: hypothetical protein L0H84_00135 [Pseudonocardia sp.]|nr:hypothetical protein [Pseudonocardia sp.]